MSVSLSSLGSSPAAVATTGTSTTVMNMLIYQNGFIGFRIGAASALSVILFAVIMAVTLIQFRYFNRRTVYELV